MRLALTGRNLTITPALRQVVTRKLARLDRLMDGGILSAQVALQVQRNRINADVRVRTRGDHELSGHGEAATAQASVVDAIAKVESQAVRVKGKWEARKRRTVVPAADAAAAPAPSATAAPRRAAKRTAAAADAPDAPKVRVVRVRRGSAKPMRLEDALPRLDTAPGSVVVYRDAALDRVQVLVRRANGDIGLVDPDA